MDDLVVNTPRWGSEGRDHKAMAILATMVSRCGKQVVGGTWLDVGCGSGGIASALAPHVHRIVGVDPEPWPSWAAMSAAHANLTFVPIPFDGDQPPLQEGIADVAICNQVYEHVADPAALIRNIHRALKPGGVCYFGGPNLLWPIEPHVYWPIVHWLPRRAAHRLMRLVGSKRAADLDAYSANLWTLRRWFEQVGFEWSDAFACRLSVELEMRGHAVLANALRRLPKSSFKLLAPFWPGFIFVLRKRSTAE